MREAAQVVAVEDQVSGDELTLAANIGTTLLTLTDATHFNETGGGTLELDDTNGTVTVLPYASADLEANTITMSATLAATWPIGTQVRVSPHEITRVAFVQPLDGDPEGELVSARVPFTMRDRVPVNEREGGLGEVIEMERVGYTFVIADVLGSLPSIDVESLPIDDIADELPPPDVTDSVPPAASPDVVLHGGVGYIAAKWDGIANNDPVTYEVHVSETLGFTPDATTKFGETRGTMAFINSLPDGTPEGTTLAYFEADGETPKAYSVVMVARDDDGSAPPGVESVTNMIQATAGDIAAGTITSEHMFAGTMSTQVLGAVDAVITNIIAGDPEGQRVVIDAAGLRVINEDGDTLVNLPTDSTQRPTFNGDLIAQNLEVIGATFLGDTTIAAGTDVQLESTTTAPGNAPGVALDYPDIPLLQNASGVPFSYGWYGLAYSPNGYATGVVPSWYVGVPTSSGYWRYVWEFNATTGIGPSRTLELPNHNDDDIWGITVIGSYLYVLFQRWSTGNYFLAKYLITDMHLSAWTNVQSVGPDITSEKPGLGTDGTDLFVVCGHAQTSPANLRVLRYNTSLALTNNVQHSSVTVDCRETGGNRTTEFSGFQKVGSDYYIGIYSYGGANISRRRVYHFTGSPTTPAGLLHGVGNHDFRGRGGEEVDGFWHDGTQFVSILDSENLTKHTNWTWAGELLTDSYVWTGYSWRDDTGSGEGSTAGQKHETLASPRMQVQHRKRAGLRVSMADLPGAGGADDANARRVYAVQQSGAPAAGALKLQATTTDNSYLLTDTPSAGAADPTTSTFGAGVPASITPQATDVAPLLANGDGFMPVGAISAFITSTPPAGWLVCDGSTKSRTTYARLFAVIGTTFGAGDGSTTFTLPNLSGRHVAGVGTGVALAEAGGATAHSSQGGHNHDSHAAAMLAHGTATNTQTTAGGAVRLTDTSNHTGTHNNDGSHGHDAHTYSADNTPPFLGLYYIIRT